MGKEKSSKLGNRKVKSLTHIQVSVTPWTVTNQAPQSMGFSRHKYWSGLPFPSPRDFPDLRIFYFWLCWAFFAAQAFL